MAKVKKTFEQWLKEVDAALVAKCGLGYNDLPDCPYSDWYENGKTAKSAAAAAYRAAKSDM